MKTTVLILSLTFTLLALTVEAKPGVVNYRKGHRPPIVVVTQQMPPVYYAPAPVCQQAPPRPVVVYRPAPRHCNVHHYNRHRHSTYNRR